MGGLPKPGITFLGKDPGAPTRYFSGYLSEVIIYGVYIPSADRLTLEADQKSYFGIL